MNQFREYENGVADVLAFLFGDTATVERNVRLPGRFSETRRQIDVLVRCRILDAADLTMIVDCKLWNSRLDVKDVESFIGLVQDVGADSGLLMVAEGASKAARARAASRVQLLGWVSRLAGSTLLAAGSCRAGRLGIRRGQIQRRQADGRPALVD